MTEGEMRGRLQDALTAKRYAHTLGVAETAERLAKKFSLDTRKARLAGLLHDCAKSMALPDMIRIAREMGVNADECETRNAAIMHAPAGAALAMRDYGVSDPEVLSAIRRHTVGGAAMTPMDLLIYVSDFIEPTREAFPGLERARALAEENLTEAAHFCARESLRYVVSRGGEAHPATKERMNDTEGRT